ncbi:hypothetical protein ACIBHX_47030 [Nonomuraea sp. NPDC050536]
MPPNAAGRGVRYFRTGDVIDVFNARRGSGIALAPTTDARRRHPAT